MSSNTVNYSLANGVATIRIDDAKRNALAPEVLDEIHHAFGRAAADEAAVIVTGREGVFSAGFDLKVMKRGGTTAIRMLSAGYRLPARVLAHPYPVVAACNGHSFAMGVFLMLSADYVIGCEGDFRIAANEVAIGLTMPRVAAAVLRNRLKPAAFQRAVTLSEVFSPAEALEAGFFDELVRPEALMDRAREKVTAFGELDQPAHAASKVRIRRALLRELRLGVPRDLVDAAMIGLRRGRK